MNGKGVFRSSWHRKKELTANEVCAFVGIGTIDTREIRVIASIGRRRFVRRVGLFVAFSISWGGIMGLRLRISALATAGIAIAGIMIGATPAAATATGCAGNAGMTDGSGSVCLTVNGSGLHVDSFKLTKKSNNRSWTDYGIVEIGSPVLHGLYGPTISCSRTATCSLTDSYVNESFPNNTKACGWWAAFPGKKACITIHS